MQPYPMGEAHHRHLRFLVCCIGKTKNRLLIVFVKKPLVGDTDAISCLGTSEEVPADPSPSSFVPVFISLDSSIDRGVWCRKPAGKLSP
ncbi:hypothetical protein TWF106_008966 [Orbilia oligospora]|uniref:Uncharacterized protein n=1 Tax=Orbilia oligospora TaxID=2813651 RepID=A0A7C8KFZ8_ORBOL|nr:hypothetical protein TWF788_001958 [Orbilia oligospora]KAF3214607.1 hypothetical protein TWF106_008966 [Orbilia oligospora]